MNTLELLQSKQLRAEFPVLVITAQDALNNITKYLKSENLQLDFTALTRQEILTLVTSYADCVVNYHPENSHPERAALLRNFETLKRCGLQNDAFEILDFA